MRIVYLIYAHKNFEQLSCLIKAIKDEWNDIYLHVDNKSFFDVHDFQNSVGDIPIKFVLPRMNVYWGHISQVAATFHGLKMIVDSEKVFDRVVLLSGQDLPVATNDQIYNFFLQNQDNEFLEYARFPVRWWPFGGYDRVLVYNFPDLIGPVFNRVLRILQMFFYIRRNEMAKINFYGSSSWFNLTYDAVKYIVEQVCTNDLINKFKFTYCIDEIFFQTILLNSKFSKNCINDCLRYMEWDKNKSHPVFLDYNDYRKICEMNKNELKYLFARKFNFFHKIV